MQQDIFIRGAMICDGTGGPAYTGDVLIGEGRILDVGPSLDAPAARVIAAEGLTLTPGFIDLHRHMDFQLFSEAFGEIELRQGITSALCGPCGMSAFPSVPDTRDAYAAFLEPCLGKSPAGLEFPSCAAWRARLSAFGPAINAGTLVGLGAVRVAACGFGDGPMTSGHLRYAAARVGEALDAGALGVSMGLMYAPECYSSREEILEMLRPLRGRGLLTCHIRGEGDLLVASVEEVLAIAERAEVPLQISHFKSTGVGNWRREIHHAIARIESARARGMDVTADVYPYDAGSTILFSLVPPEFVAHGQAAALEALGTQAGRAALRRELGRRHEGWDNAALGLGYGRITLSSAESEEFGGFVGRSLEDIAAETGAHPADVVARILVATGGRAGITLHSMCPEDVDDVVRFPWSMPISDALYGAGARPHPRLYGAFPRFLREYALDRRLLTLEEAVCRMTSRPAQRAGLRDRGRIAKGMVADLALFDPGKLRDRATYADPVRLCEGMEIVVVGGRVALEGTRWRRGLGVVL